MAQALFDEHPLEQYLQEAGEASDLMPGGVAEFTLEQKTHSYRYPEDETNNVEWLPSFIVRALEITSSVISTNHLSSHPSPFVERFKYDVISSSLLATSLPMPHRGRPSTSLTIPGRLRMDHSPTSSIGDSPTQHASTTNASAEESQSWFTSLAFLLVAASFSAGYYALATLLLAGTLIYVHISQTDGPSRLDMTPTLETLGDLVAASDVWDSVVQDAITIVEKDEQSTFYSPTTPSSPSSSLRVALHSSLHTTQTQCDNIRQLLSALTLPSELSQLSEMYAPASPMKSSFSDLSPDNPRPISFPSHKSNSPISADSDIKRSTWNGSYSSLALAGSPTMQVLKRREKRRSDISALLQATSPTKSISAPVTPMASDSTLLGVLEEPGDKYEPDLSHGAHFGIAALDLHRERKVRGMETFGIPSLGHSSSTTPRGTRSPPATFSSGSRFTTMQATRHPLSLSALNHALQGAIASKRYACSHLLALRFGDEDDEGYWEDVRSVMGLLTTTLADASSRLTVALEFTEKEKLKDENPTPEYTISRTGSMSPKDDGNGREGRRVSSRTLVSFAPVPSHLSRFAAHVDAISSALNDAREHLEHCVASLREESPVAHMRRRRSHSPPRRHESPEPQAPPALQSYERLRRELGVALRECERGRERLLDVVSPPEPREDTDDDNLDDLPALGHDISDDSDKPDSSFAVDDDNEGTRSVAFTVVPPDGAEGAVDDVTSHLLLTSSSQHLPPQGIEQVFESESGGGVVFTRERSKLTREERIQLAKARRESGGGHGHGNNHAPEPENPGMEKWGPGGEVVQELKDVIWKVGERRRRMTDGPRPLQSVIPAFSTEAVDP